MVIRTSSVREDRQCVGRIETASFVLQRVSCSQEAHIWDRVEFLMYKLFQRVSCMDARPCRFCCRLPVDIVEYSIRCKVAWCEGKRNILKHELLACIKWGLHPDPDRHLTTSPATRPTHTLDLQTFNSIFSVHGVRRSTRGKFRQSQSTLCILAGRSPISRCIAVARRRRVKDYGISLRDIVEGVLRLRRRIQRRSRSARGLA